MGTIVILDIYLEDGFEREYVNLCVDNAVAIIH
jgi:hypothetical protein